ncbi:MAG: PDZ domain-containing protein [Ignavibacteriaceae bacterium]|nr:PDZ domain-containing protein [Ignavibacteriaceae bacterium]
MFKSILLLLCFSIIKITPAQDEARLLRFPAIHGNQVVFSYAGDLYTVPSSGGTARKITSDIGYEMFAKFSPDGKYIAFTGQYDGNTEVYLIPAEGGIPKRLTYTATLNRDDVSDRMGPNNIVMCWKGNDTIIYRSRMHEFNDFIGDLFAVSINGGPSVQLPLPRGGFCSYSPDFKKLAYNRVFREFRTWKHYRGGQADDIWIYDFATKKIENITNNPAQDIFPMWTGNKIYFISDRDYRLNLFSYNLDTKETKKVTNFKDYDIKFPSIGDNAITFENGGYLYRFDLTTEKAEKITVYINEDFSIGRSKLIDVSKSITNFDISPDGSRALFGARGEIFTVPVKNGNTRNITNTSGVHERDSKWSPDGKWISYISDASGEDELYIRSQDGKGEPIRITTNGDVYKYQPYWSPDSKKLLWSDRRERLQYIDIDSKEITTIAQATEWEITEYSWSPDSKWVAYAKPEEKTMDDIYLYSLESKKNIPVTDGWYTSGSPVFSTDGKYLFIVSERSFTPKFGWTEFDQIYQDMSKIYLITLAADTKSPLEPQSDEVKIKENKGEKETDKKESKEKQENVEVRVDQDGIQSRIIELTPETSNFGELESAGNKIYYIRRGSNDPKPQLVMYDLEKRKVTELGEANGFEISADQKKMIVSWNNSYFIIDLPLQKIDLKEKLNLSDMKMNLDRDAEWEQIFNESWRQMRDFFFAPNMHGVNWQAMKEKYGPLVKYVNHRADLTYIIGEMISELNIGHAYVGGGDYPRAERIKLGLLGAKLDRDPKTKFYKISKILKGQNWDKETRSPLTEIGVNVKEGDYIIAVDNKPVDKMNDIFEALVNTAGKQVILKVNSEPKEAGSHETIVIPTDDELQLYYYNWVEDNIAKVNKATNGRVGYIHIPDMGVPGLNEFTKYYYPQIRKEALIIDDRGNGGGNVSPIIAEKLRREPVFIDITRNSAPSFDPGGMHVGPKVLLINEFSASDGDIFPYRFRMYHLGKIIGKRTWGGVTGIRGTLPLVDGGFLNRPEFSRYDLEGKEWIMEGHGVDPDIVIDNDPALEFEGTDQQLDKAIEQILLDLKNNPPNLPKPPAYPDMSK